MTHRDLPALDGALLAAHRRYIVEAASRKRLSPFRKAHSPAAVRVLSDWSQTVIPQPSYMTGVAEDSARRKDIMPAYRFSWDLFDDRTVFAFATDIGFQGVAEGAREYLRSRVKRPDDDFVRTTKTSIAEVWLPQQAAVGEKIVRELFDMLIGPIGTMPTDAEGCARYVGRCTP